MFLAVVGTFVFLMFVPALTEFLSHLFNKNVEDPETRGANKVVALLIASTDALKLYWWIF